MHSKRSTTTKQHQHRRSRYPINSTTKLIGPYRLSTPQQSQQYDNNNDGTQKTHLHQHSQPFYPSSKKNSYRSAQNNSSNASSSSLSSLASNPTTPQQQLQQSQSSFSTPQQQYRQQQVFSTTMTNSTPSNQVAQFVEIDDEKCDGEYLSTPRHSIEQQQYKSQTLFTTSSSTTSSNLSSRSFSSIHNGISNHQQQQSQLLRTHSSASLHISTSSSSFSSPQTAFDNNNNNDYTNCNSPHSSTQYSQQSDDSSTIYQSPPTPTSSQLPSYIYEENIPIHQQCKANTHTPCHAIFSLQQISSLLGYISSGSIVIFDIDDTIVKRTYNDSSLLTQQGSQMFTNYLQSPACQHMSFDEKQSILRQLQLYARDFTLAEVETALIISTLQQRGCYVFALTARSSQMASFTNQTLNALGIDFKTSLPPSMPIQGYDSTTGAVVVDGVIYCNDCPKGIVFQQFLAKKWITFPVLHQCNDMTCSYDPQCTFNNKIVSHTGKTNGIHHETNDTNSCPQRSIWFIDDNYHMLHSMMEEWRLFAAKHVSIQEQQQQQQLLATSSSTATATSNTTTITPCQGKLQLICCHYSHPTNYILNPDANPVKVDNDVLGKLIAMQISYFLKSKVLLNDKTALDILTASPQWPSGNVTPTNNDTNIDTPTTTTTPCQSFHHHHHDIVSDSCTSSVLSQCSTTESALSLVA